MARRNYNKISQEIANVEELQKENLNVGEEPTTETNICQRMATVISTGKLNVREGPSKDSKVVCVVDPGSGLLIENVDGKWAHVYTSSGIEGYVMIEFIKEV